MRPAAAVSEGGAAARGAPCCLQPAKLVCHIPSGQSVRSTDELVGHAMICNMPQDDDPYVRKTAAICVAKLFDINAELVQDRGFLDTLVVRISGLSPHTTPC